MWLSQPPKFSCPPQMSSSERSLYLHGLPCKNAFHNSNFEHIPGIPARPWMRTRRLESTTYIMEQIIISQPDKQLFRATYEFPPYEEGDDDEDIGLNSGAEAFLVKQIISLPGKIGRNMSWANLGTQNFAFCIIKAVISFWRRSFSLLCDDLPMRCCFVMPRAPSSSIAIFSKLWRCSGSHKTFGPWKIIMLALAYLVVWYANFRQQKLDLDMRLQREGVTYVLVKEFRRWQA